MLKVHWWLCKRRAQGACEARRGHAGGAHEAHMRRAWGAHRVRLRMLRYEKARMRRARGALKARSSALEARIVLFIWTIASYTQ